MNGVDATSDVRAARRMAQVLAALGIVLLGMVIGGWAGPSVDFPVGPAMTPPLWLGVGTLLLLVAALLARRAGTGSADGGLRDPATGLYRASYVAETVANLMARDDRTGNSHLGLVCIRVNYLDDIGRRYGHAAVAELLRFAGRHVRGQARGGDLPQQTRDGFEVFLQCEELEQAEAFCRRLTMLLAREQIELRGDVVKIDTRMGAAVRLPGETLQEFRDRALSGLADSQPAVRVN